MATATAPARPEPLDPIPPNLSTLLSGLLTASELSQLTNQLLSSWARNKQVFWTGNLRDKARKWAVSRGMTTLSMAMGPLLEDNNPLRLEKGKKAISKYMKGASALFAWFATADDFVTIVCPPPPTHFNPEGRTTMQLIELPILIGVFGGRAVPKINIVHPTVKRAVGFTYQFWPTDESHEWKKEYAKDCKSKTKWLKRAETSLTSQLENLLRQRMTDLGQRRICLIILPQNTVQATRQLPTNDKNNIKHMNSCTQLSPQTKATVKQAKVKSTLVEPPLVSNGIHNRKILKVTSHTSTSITTSNNRTGTKKSKSPLTTETDSLSQSRKKLSPVPPGQARRGCSDTPKRAGKDSGASQKTKQKKRKKRKKNKAAPPKT
ncbi:hypothetical protein B0T11DRAFT_288480 [Plectosphaerella cucumerina]|uniref:Uncharacterized protein n=1 Tax=Plectosphaerella cucumerina TaxID=40658 RepID=A0A8K0TBC6_9PEZI|nr:hypothetical protein B0T11DRAFT_288480 [Plectosphaerella cucumerina]